MISIRSLSLAVSRSLARRRADEISRYQIEAARRARVEAQEAVWRAEQQQREEAALDADGSRAAARAARDEQLEEARLAFLTAQLVRRV